MTSSKWQEGNDHQLPVAVDPAARAQALLRLSAAEAEPPAQLRTRILTSFEKRIQRKNSAWMWLAPATAVTMVVVLIAFGYWKLRAPRPPMPLPMVANRILDVHPATPTP